ncbi:hypothetical protein ACROYT_G038367 [Oculina patagonica]
MAALLEIPHNPKKPSKEIFSEFFMPEDTIDQPCDVILVVELGKQFKAHRQVLSEASPFFEKLLNSDMKEAKEGVVRLEMFSQSVMGNTLEFIYTGNVGILTEDNARDLIVMADYLFLQDLKTLAERSFTTDVEYFQLEIEMFISSDEINVNAEEVVFNVILSWIDHDRSKRKKYFAELFRHVRLVYVSRDFLCKDIVTNDLVRDSEGCLDLVDDAVKLIESKDFSNLSVTPRKSLETSVIVVFYQGHNIVCYFLEEDRWCCLGHDYHNIRQIGLPSCCSWQSQFVFCRGKLYGILESPPLNRQSWDERESFERRLVSFNPYSNSWTVLPYKEDRFLQQIFATNEDELYALVSEPCKYHGLCRQPGMHNPFDTEVCRKEKHVSFITKYKPESNSWEDISSFDHLGFRRHLCIVTRGNVIYFIGGRIEWWLISSDSVRDSQTLTDVDRYDLSKDQWSKVANIHEAGWYMYSLGAAVNENIFFAYTTEQGGCHCEVNQVR